MPGKFTIQRLILALGCLITLMGGLASAQATLSVDEAFRLSAHRDTDASLRLEWQVAPGHYLYRDKIVVAAEAPLAVATPAGEMKDDPNFGLTEIYHDRVIVPVEGEAARAGVLRITYQGCSEGGLCYPPVTRSLDPATLELTEVATGLRFGTNAGLTPAIAPPPQPDRGGVAPPDSPMMGSLVLTLASFLGFGLLLSLTPCVFPMIPILSGMLARAGERLSARRGFVLSTAYVLAMALAYAVLGLVAAWSGQNLQVVLQSPWALGLMAAIFVGLALSMFGLFELQVPVRWSGWVSGRAQGRAGSIGGAALLGFGSALIVGPCVTPPLAAALLYVAQTGDGARGVAALFALGLGMGLPLIVFGTFGSRVLPKSGPWLVWVKQLFGVVFLGLAAAMVLRALPEEFGLPVWGVGALGAAVFLGAFDRLTGASGWMRRLEKTAGLALAIYGATLIVGFAGGASDPLRPLAFLSAKGSTPTAAPSTALVVDSEAAFDQALAAARTAGKPALVSFTADWCTVCKSNDRVFADPAVAAALAGVSFIKADVTHYGEDSRRLMQRFDIVGPPTMFLLGSTGTEIAGSRRIGAISADDLTRPIERAVSPAGGAAPTKLFQE